MDAIDQVIDETIGKEGGYVNHPNDPGGPTRWGITQDVARANGYAGDMRDLPRETAFAIYRRVYLDQPGFGKVAALSMAIAAELFDTGVNMGPSWPGRWLQQWLNVFNARGTLYPDIAVDGQIGPGTLAALKAYLAKRGAEAETVMVRALNCSQGARYEGITEGRAANEDFVYGWMRTRVK